MQARRPQWDKAGVTLMRGGQCGKVGGSGAMPMRLAQCGASRRGCPMKQVHHAKANNITLFENILLMMLQHVVFSALCASDVDCLMQSVFLMCFVLQICLG